MTTIDWVLIAALVFCFSWASYLHQIADMLNKRLNILTSIVVSGLTPQQLAAMQQFNIHIIERPEK